MAKASFRTVDEVGSVQRLARPLDKPLQLPSLLTMDEAGQPRDVRVSTLQFVAGVARYTLFPCCFCRRACKGTMTSEAAHMVKVSTFITTVQFCCAGVLMHRRALVTAWNACPEPPVVPTVCSRSCYFVCFRLGGAEPH